MIIHNKRIYNYIDIFSQNQQYTCQLFQDNIKIVEVEATRTDSSEVVCTNLQVIFN